ncbi:nickel pincer cofactor biosynthesis protein LarC [Caloramator sp. CAR-1]|uniref:nickel pincer cofactor biosynthesis protein LarC n=1 Tax=Caloramator sp. CAR-1 TaxID=3062777 RepID=UPI0026E3C5D3|nr:nickel pincer cofactor biosynthesis protein LarC [Caloramator sp. CAR-1]MDO6354789.1 nickel pincer cofactor biosynthesis protein LarC [Caloramator sp. CAR-1]
MILYFDCFSGISGDMAVGALLDLGVPKDYLIENLKSLNIDEEYQIEIRKSNKNGIEGTDFYVFLKEENIHHHERNLKDIISIIDKSRITDGAKNIAKKIFNIIAEAEAKVHGKSIDEVHFHEVGAVDSIIDIVGVAVCIDYLKPDKIISSYVNTGSGFVKCQHGILPVPAPATMNILKDVPIYSDERKFELTTPTGAAILKGLCTEFVEGINMKIRAVGYGCGKKNTEKPNVLRIVLGEEDKEEVVLLETTIDDMNPQFYGYVMDKLFEKGALDVYLTPVYMKKNRPGIVISVLVHENKEKSIIEVLFKETTTIGIRKFKIKRYELQREIKRVETEFGKVDFKISKYEGEIVNISPEFEDLKRISMEKGLPLKDVYNFVRRTKL